MATQNYKARILSMGRNTPTSSGWFSAKVLLLSPERRPASIKGFTDGYDIGTGSTITFTADTAYNAKYGEQLDIVRNSLMLVPGGRLATVKFLSGSKFPGIGQVLAEKLYDKFGDDLFDVIKNRPVELSNFGVPDKKIETLRNNLLDSEGTLMAMFPQLSQGLAAKIIKRYENADIAASYIRKDPYALIDEIEGYQFRTADKIALEALHMPKENWNRLIRVVQHTLRELFAGGMKINGQTPSAAHNSVLMLENTSEFTEFKQMMDKNAGFDITPYDLSALIMDTSKQFYVIINVPQLGKCLMLYEGFNGENAIFAATKGTARHNFKSDTPIDKMITRCDNEYFTETGERMDPFQKNAIKTALDNPISAITGGPGCGKSMIVKYICDIWQRGDKNPPMTLLAPTGRAAKNLKEKTGRNATTMASLAVQIPIIKKAYKSYIKKNLNTNTFNYESKTLSLYSKGLAIIDEASMIGSETMGKVLCVLCEILQMQVILVGDTEQLPPIDYGQPFKDLIDNNAIPVAVLPICHRAEVKTISDNGRTAMKGDYDAISWTGNFKMQPTDDEERSSEILKLLYYARMGIDMNNPQLPGPDAFKKTMLLAAVKKGKAGIGNLNLAIQDFLNPKKDPSMMRTYELDPFDPDSAKYTDVTGIEIPRTRYDNGETGDANQSVSLRIGDRVVYTKNDTEIEGVRYDDDDTKHKDPIDTYGINNGDCGNIIRYILPKKNTPGFIVIHTDDDRYMNVPIATDRTGSSNLQLGYALTVHKAQGSETECVLFSAQHRVAALPPEYDIANQNLFNTAVTRAKKEVTIVGSDEMVKRCVATPIKDRITALGQWL